MKIIKVNNITNFLAIRYLAINLICYLTLIFTGRIADMAVLMGWQPNYDASGVSTSLAKTIFSSIGFLGNKYLIISFLGLLLSLIIYLLLRNNIDKTNIYLWKIILLAPGLLIYTNSPTKETLFFYPSILYIILECNYITAKRSINFLNFLLKLFLLLIMFLIRGDIAIPYFLLSIFSLILKNVKIGEMYKRLSLNLLLLRAFLLSIFSNIIISLFFPKYIERITQYIGSALAVQENLYRPDQFINPFNEPFRLIYTQYLALFPTVGEMLQKPYVFLIVLDSILIVYCFVKSWSQLFDLLHAYKILKKIVSILFIYISIVYFSLFSVIGSINIGASQRFRVNFIPLGIIFPLILKKKLIDKETTYFLKSKNI